MRRAVVRRLVYENFANLGTNKNPFCFTFFAFQMSPSMTMIYNYPEFNVRLIFQLFFNSDFLSLGRFCCMSPLSGRKRSVRDLARKQIATRQV